MKGYIKRLSQDIEWLESKRDCIANFLTDPREEIDDEQARLLNEQSALMGQLVEVMKQRLEYERKIHPDYFEDLDVAKQAELVKQLGDEVEKSALALMGVGDADDCDDSEETTEE